MQEVLLQTKLFVPSLRQPHVQRPQLVEKLNAGLDRKLTLVSAAAGYGKSSIISSWIHQLNQPVAWLSLDTGDNDPTRFWIYVIAALQRAQAGLGENIQFTQSAPQPPPFENLLTELINQIIALPDKVILILDDYHVLESREIHQAIGFLLEHLPPQIHLVIVSRTDPPLNIARMRGQGQLNEMRETDLRFTLEETNDFFLNVAQIQFSSDSVAALHRRTEGWVVGLQLAGLAMQGREDTNEFVQAFAGDHSYVIDYLTEEVLQRLSPSVQQFLIESSILDRLSGPLCDATLSSQVNQGLDSQAMLEILDQKNMFLLPVDDRRQWYRYHHLFADILRYRLKQTQPGLVPFLHRRASAWFAEHGLVAEALHHAMAAGAYDRAADLIESVTRPMIGSGESSTVQAWIEALPESLLRQRPLLCVSLAWTYNLNQTNQLIEPLLQQAENALESGTFEENVVADVRGNVAILRGYIALQQNDPKMALEYMEESLAILPEDDVYLRSLVSFTQGVIYKRGCIWQLAARKLMQASDYGRISGNLTVAIGNRVHLIEMLITQGQLRQAATICEEVITYHLADRRGNQVPYLGFVYSKQGEILYEWNELEAANHHLERGLAMAEQLMVNWSWTRDGLVYQARLRQLQGDYTSAQVLMKRAIAMSTEMQDRFDRIDISYWLARLHLAQNDLTAAVRWGREYLANPTAHTEAADIVLARVFLAREWIDKALDMLTAICEAAEATGRLYTQIETLILLALGYWKQEDVLRAKNMLERALSMAEPEGLIRSFVDEGAPMVGLLRKFSGESDGPLEGDHHYSKEYVSRLLGAFPIGETSVSRPVAEIGALNDREIQVLRLMAVGLKTPEIAEELHLSNNTIKWYCRNLYSKLGVHTKAEAIAEGHQIGLLK